MVTLPWRRLRRWNLGVAHSTARRMALAFAGVQALSMLLVGVLTWWAVHVVFLRQIDATIRNEAAALVHAYRTEGTAGVVRNIAGRENRHATPLGYALYDAGARRIAGDLDTPRPPPGWSVVTFSDPVEGHDQARGLALDLHPGLRLLVAADPEFLEGAKLVLGQLLAVALGLSLLLGALGAWQVGVFLRRRLQPVTATAEAIVRGTFDQRVPLRGHGDEFDRVAVSLNLMLERIASLVANLRQVSGDLAHDLRTPLTRLRGALEQGLREHAGPEEQRLAMERAWEQSDSMLAIFEAILRIAEIEEGVARRRFVRLDLGALARDMVEAVEPAAEDTRHRLETELGAGVWIEGDRQLLAQALANLLANALLHTPGGTRIRVCVAADPAGQACLRVADDGPGVPAGDRARVLERFVRLDSSRHTPGNGLGLSLVRAIASLHRATLQLSDNRPGLDVRMVFRAVPAPGPTA